MSSLTGFKAPRAVLFDWDNTLVNTWPTIVECYRDTFLAMGMTPWTPEEVQIRAHGSLRDVFPKFFGARAGDAERVFYETFHRIHLERLEPCLAQTCCWLTATTWGAMWRWSATRSVRTCARKWHTLAGSIGSFGP